jgi:hypothetical protein
MHGEPSIWTITAAWVEAIGAFAAVIGSGWFASRSTRGLKARYLAEAVRKEERRARATRPAAFMAADVGDLHQSRGGRARGAGGDWGPIFEMYNKQMERVDISANHQLSAVRRALRPDVGTPDATAAASLVGDYFGFKTPPLALAIPVDAVMVVYLVGAELPKRFALGRFAQRGTHHAV